MEKPGAGLRKRIMEDNVAISDPQNTESGRAKWIIAVVCLVVLGAGWLGNKWLTQSAPKATRRPPVKITPLVRVQKVVPETQSVVVHATGTVLPAKELMLKSRVAGEVVNLHPEFTEGGLLRKGKTLLLIDDLDYQLIVAQKRGAVANADFNLKLELGRQDVAQREWSLLNGDNPTPDADAELALRKPHLEKARSDLEAAKAELKAAELQLARTRIKAPFNAVVRSTAVELGSQVGAQEQVAMLAGTDVYWIQVSVPVDRLAWIDIPESNGQIGTPAEVSYQNDVVRQGHVKKLLSDLEEKGRMARLVVEVADPLSLKKENTQPAMLIGEYVRVAIQGRQIDSAYRIPREALRENTHVWVLDPEDKLVIREVQILWRDADTVLLQEGLSSGDRVVISNLATPVAGMALQVEGNGIKATKSAVPRTRKRKKAK